MLWAGYGYTLTLSNSTIVSNTGEVTVAFGTNVLESNMIYQGLTICPGNIVSGTTFARGAGIYLNNCSRNGVTRIFSNTFEQGGVNSPYGSGSSEMIFIQWNKFTHLNGPAISLRDCNAIVNYNNFIREAGNTERYVFHMHFNGTTCEVDATNNWWGTTNVSEIDLLIYDYNDNFELPKVKYQPIATTPYP